MLLVQVVRIPAAGVVAFQEFESRVLPLLGDHRGSLEDRFRTVDEQTEVHVVWFPTVEDLDAYLVDSRRVDALHLLEASGATAELLEVVDVRSPIGGRPRP